MAVKGLELWEKVEKSDQRYLKKVSYGKRSFTTIDAYYQLKTATSLWGPYGSTWGLKDTNLEIVNIGETPMAIYKATFYYPDGEFEVYNAIRINDDEFAKKLETDTITKALSRLGFNADVFLGEYDGNRYVYGQKPKTETNSNTKTTPETNKPADQSKNLSIEEIEKSLAVLGLKLNKEKGYVEGKTYGKSSKLTALGFVWDPDSKKWWLKDLAPVRTKE